MLWLALAAFVLMMVGGPAYLIWSFVRRRKGGRVPGGSIQITGVGLLLYGVLVAALFVGFGAATLSPRDGLGLWVREHGHITYAAMVALVCAIAEGLLRVAGYEPIKGIVRKPRRPPRTLETRRLRLRAPTESDIDAIFEYASDAEVTRFMDWRRLERRDEVRDFLTRMKSEWEAGTEFMWVITEKGADRVIGGISIRPRASDADFGYVLGRRFWNRGIATEAATAVTWWAISRRGLPRIWATCDVENTGSARVLEKLGLKREGLVPGGAVRPNLSAVPRDTYRYGRGAVG